MTAFAISVQGSELVGTGTLTLAAATPQNVDVPMSGRRWLSLLIKNTGGSNSVTAVDVYVSPCGTLFAPVAAYGAAIGTIAHDTVGPGILIDEGPQKTVRITLTSTSGTTVALELRAR